MSPTEAIPLLIVVLLLASIGGGDIEQMTISFQGEHSIGTLDDAHVIAGGTTTVPADAAVTGDIYVIGGTTRIEGDLDGDVTLLAGNLTVVDGASVTGTLQVISGESTVADNASVGQVSTFEPPAPSSSPARQIGGFLLQFFLVGFTGWWLVRRHPSLLNNIGHSITNHTLVSGVVGTLGAATLLVLFVYMAFTLLLIPLSVAGLVGEVLVVLYSQVVYGHLVGRRLPIERDDLATVAGIGLFLLALEFLGFVPYLGVLVQLALIVVGFGAVLNTYFGLQRFDPVTIPGGAD